MQYASSVSSYAVLHLVTHLTFTIINVLKRLFIIVAGMLYTNQHLRPLNTLGVVLAIGGGCDGLTHWGLSWPSEVGVMG